MIAVSALAPSSLPPLPVVLPLAGAALLAAFRRWLSRTAADSLALLIAAGTLLACSLLLHRSLSGPLVYWFGNWYPRGTMAVGIAFLVEPVNAGLTLLATLLTLLSLLFSWRSIEAGANHLQPLLLIFLAAMNGFVLTSDLFNLFVFFELMSTAAFALCGLKTAEPAPLQGSLNFAITNTVAAFLVLTGIALLYAVTGALNMAQIGLLLAGRHDPLVLFAFTLLTCGFLVKAAAVPFHLWLGDAHAVAPTPVCVLFSGMMVELGLYAVVRLHTVVFGQLVAAHQADERLVLMLFAAASVLTGGVMCYAEHHLKRILAFSTISHAGLMLLCFALGGPLALNAMLIYLLAHAFVKSSLFFTSGLLLRRLRAIGERALYRQGGTMKTAAVLWFGGGLGLAAAPGFCTMRGEAVATLAAQKTHVPEWTVSGLFLVAGILTAAAVFRVGMHTFFGWGALPITDRAAEVGELPEQPPSEKELRWYHLAPPALCLALSMLLTFWAGWRGPLQHASMQMSSQSSYLQAIYTGQPKPLSGLTEDGVLLGQSAWHGSLAVLFALALAATSVFRSRLPRWARAGAFLERGFKSMRAWQSGHPGDYVFWLISGVSGFGILVLTLFRR